MASVKRRPAKAFRLLSILLLIALALPLLSTLVSADTVWNGESGPSSSGTANGSGYAVPSAFSYLAGYRFSIVSRTTKSKLSGTYCVDILRDSIVNDSGSPSDSDSGLLNRYRATSQHPKSYYAADPKRTITTTQIKNGSGTWRNAANLYYETSGGVIKGYSETLTRTLYSRLPSEEEYLKSGSDGASGFEQWQSKNDNLNAIVYLCSRGGKSSVSALSATDVIVVEPLYRFDLGGAHVLMTVTEVNAYAYQTVCGGADVQIPGGTPNSFGFIRRYTSGNWSNALYTPKGMGLWSDASGPVSTDWASVPTALTVIKSGYGVGIVYKKEDIKTAYDINLIPNPGHGGYFTVNGTKANVIKNVPMGTLIKKVSSTKLRVGNSYTITAVANTDFTFKDFEFPAVMMDMDADVIGNFTPNATPTNWVIRYKNSSGTVVKTVNYTRNTNLSTLTASGAGVTATNFVGWKAVARTDAGYTQTGSWMVGGMYSGADALGTGNYGYIDLVATYKSSSTATPLYISGYREYRGYTGGAQSLSGGYVTSGLKDGHYLASCSGSTGACYAVSTWKYTPSGAVIKDTSGNNVTSQYSITYSPGALIITPKDITIYGKNGIFTYDGATHTVSGITYEGLNSGHTITATNDSVSRSAVGSSTYTPSVTIKNSSGTNINWCYNITIIDGSITIAQTHTVSFNANGGSGAPSSQTKIPGTVLTLSSTQPTRSGFIFTGWNTMADGTGDAYAPGAKYYPDEDVTLYAQWVPISYNISYNLGGGSFPSGTDKYLDTGSYVEALNPTTVRYNGTGTYNGKYCNYSWFKVEPPTRAGYTFAGWDVSGMDTTSHQVWWSGHGSETFSTASYSMSWAGFSEWKYLRATSGTVTFTAKWVPNTYTNTIYHYKYTPGVGNNEPGGNWTLVQTTSHSGTYGQTQTFDATHRVSVTGFHYRDGYHDATGSNTGFVASTSFVQPAKNVIIHYFYDPNTYTNTIYHYKYTPGVGNNEPGGNWTLVQTTSHSGTYGQTQTFDATHRVSVTGFHYRDGYHDATGSNTGFVASTSFVQPAKNVIIHYFYDPNTYTNTVWHWAWGFQNGEGNNGDKTAFHLSDTTFSKNAGSTFVMDSSYKTTIPNGFYLSNNLAGPNSSGSWSLYPMGTEFTQSAGGMGFEYDYSPITYTITYDLGGGTNSSSNPSTYNVLYGVTFADPTREGYTFDGWYIDGVKVTGINPGCNATFSSAEDLYAKLAARTTGNKTVTAKWTAVTSPPILTPVPANIPYREGTEVITTFRLSASSMAFTASSPLQVRFRVYNTANNQLLLTVQKAIVCPANEDQICYFKWLVPTLTEGDGFKITADYFYSGQWQGQVSGEYDYRAWEITYTPDTKYEDRPPAGWSRPGQPVNRSSYMTWSEWICNADGSFARIQYGVRAIAPSAVIVPQAPTAYQKGGYWYFKSGYGFTITAASCTLTAADGCSMPASSAYTNCQYAYLQFPEFRYAGDADCVSTLEKVGSGWQLYNFLNYGRIHYTPVWYPDGAYYCNLVQADIWTPMGAISVSRPTEKAVISGSMYDDWYIGHG